MRRFLSLLPQRGDWALVRTSWRVDVLAGVTVGIVALPLALGFGISSGATAEAGIVTAIVAGIIAAVFGGSNVQVSGPTGAMVVILVPIAALHGIAGLALVSIMAGIIVLAAGVLKLGRSISFIPWPVIEGFTLGIGVIIFLQQVPFLFSPNAKQHSTNALIAAIRSVGDLETTYFGWALGAVIVVAIAMVGLNRIHPTAPGSLVGIIVVTAAVLVFNAPLSVIGELPSSLPMPSVPPFDAALLQSLAVPAITVAALAAIESLLSARVASGMAERGGYDPDRELVGQGLASIGSGLFGGMPATGAIARTAVSVRSGAQTRLASVVHALVLLGVVLIAGKPVGLIPHAALAGVLMVTAVRMVNIPAGIAVLKSTRSDAFAYIVTAAVTIAVDLVMAALIGLVVASIFALRRLANMTGVHREELPGEPVAGDERIAAIRIDGPLFFAVADRVLTTVTAVRDVSVVILQMSRVEAVDATGARVLANLVERLEANGITVLIKGVRPAQAHLLQTVGVVGSLRHHKHLFDDMDSAIAHARSHIERENLAASTPRTVQTDSPSRGPDTQEE